MLRSAARGAREYFDAASRIGYPHLYNVQADAYIRAHKCRGNALPEEHRARLLDSLRLIDFVHLCRTSTADILERLRPAVCVKGTDRRGQLPREQLDLCDRLGIRIEYLETVTVIFPSRIDLP